MAVSNAPATKSNVEEQNKELAKLRTSIKALDGAQGALQKALKALNDAVNGKCNATRAEAQKAKTLDAIRKAVVKVDNTTKLVKHVTGQVEQVKDNAAKAHV